MKSIMIIALSFFLFNTMHAQTIQADSVKNYDGKTITVCSKIVDTHVTTGEHKMTYLNFDHPYPNQSFTGVIFDDDLSKFSYVPSEFLKGKTVCVTGKVKIYKGRPEIVISSESQLKVQ